MSFAQDVQLASAGTQSYDLGEIVISTDKDSVQDVTSVVEISAEDIESTGATNAAEALDYSPGVRFSIGGRKYEGSVFIRGFQQDRILIMLNGIPIGAPYYREMDLSLIPADNISKIVVTKGASSTMYGTNALGGVINIVTKKPEKGTSGSLTLAGGENSELAPSFRYGANNGNYYYSISGKHHESDGFEVPGGFIPVAASEDGGLRNQSDFEKDDIALMIGKETENSEYAFSINYVDAERGTPFDVTTTKGWKNRFTEWKKWTLDLSGQQTISENTQLREKLYFHKFDNELTGYTSFDYDTIATNDYGDPDISLFDDYTVGARILADMYLKDETLMKIGLNVNRENHKKEASPGYQTDKYVTDNYSLGVEFEKSINQRLTLTAGLSYDMLSQEEANEANDAGTGTTEIQTGGTMEAVNPVVGLVYDVNDYTTLHFSAARKTRFPTQHELYTDAADAGTGTTLGNKDLDPEKNSMFETGYDIRFESGLNFSAAYFYNKSKDYIDCAGTGTYIGSKEVCIYENALSFTSKGAEFGLSSKFKDSFFWSIMHTHTVASVSSSSETQADYIPKGKTDITLERSFDSFAVLNLNGSYLTSTQDSGSRYTNYIKPYFIMNANVSGDIPSANMKWKLLVENVFDKLYWEEVGYPQAGRTFKAELQYNF